MKRADEEPTPKAIENALTQDPLHRKREIEDFLKMLIAVEPPYTFVIDAPWGSGKTFFVKQVARALQMIITATLLGVALGAPQQAGLPAVCHAWSAGIPLPAANPASLCEFRHAAPWCSSIWAWLRPPAG